MTQGERGRRNAEMIRLYESGMSYRELAPIFGISFQAVQQIIKRYGKESRPCNRPRKIFDFSEYASIIAEMREVGRSVTYISKIIKIAPTSHQWDEFVQYVENFPKYGGDFLKCWSCGEIKPASEFYKNRRGACKECDKKYQKDVREKRTPEQKKAWNEYIREYNKTHKRKRGSHEDDPRD